MLSLPLKPSLGRYWLQNPDSVLGRRQDIRIRFLFWVEGLTRSGWAKAAR